MKRLILFIITMLFFLSSCTGVSYVFLEEERGGCSIIGYGDDLYFSSNSRWNVKFHTYATNAGKVLRPRFCYNIYLITPPDSIASFRLHSLEFYDYKGRKIEYNRRYDVLNVDTNTLVINDYEDSISFSYKGSNSIPKIDIFAKCKVRRKKITVVYDIEVNGERVKGERTYLRAIMIAYRPSLPGQPWYIIE
ncbi:MAG: hypothetical protein IJT39_09620 [Bacteroidales bacterium]|nr:hypothetical protein [Bacteroidales bacterium]